ncbi:MAG: hypothetical protein JW797_19480 [Bradymonadales bacterium]|nr:hypothetical protein [Bradymonadales bacterium]
MSLNRTACFCFLLSLGTWSIFGCPEDKEPSDWLCDCEPGQICRDGVCYPADAGGDAGDMGQDWEFVDNPDCPASGMVINELVYDPITGTPEWVEVMGPPLRDLSGFRLVHINGTGGGTLFDIPLSGGLGTDGFFLLAASAMDGADQLSEELVLQNGPDNLRLLDCGGQTVDAVGYGNFTATQVFAGEGSPAESTGRGPSLSRCPGAVDTGDNGADFHIADQPTPAAENANFRDVFACEACEGGTFDGKVVINEVLYDPTGSDSVTTEFIELRGDAGLSIFGLTVELVNGSDNEVYRSFTLDGRINDDGLYTIGGDPQWSDFSLPVTLQNGPDSIRLVDCEGAVVDALAYGTFEATEFPAGEGASAAAVGQGYSVARCAGETLAEIDSNDNATDFFEATPTPFAANTGFTDELACGGSSSCVSGAFDGKVVINEILYDPTGSDSVTTEFLELRGAPGLNLAGLTVHMVNGSSGDIYQSFALSGQINEDGLFTIGGAAELSNFALLGTIQNGPDSVQLLDCEGSVVDALAYGTFDLTEFPAGEGTSAEGVGQNHSLARCPGATLAEIDSNNNAADFHEATPSPFVANTGFTDIRACGGTGCEPGLLTGRLHLNELLPGESGFVEVRGEANLGLADTSVVVLDGAGTELGVLDLTGSLDGNGYAAVDVTVIPSAGGTLKLRDCEDVVIDAVAWGVGASLQGEGPAAPAPAAGQSLGRCPQASDTNNNYADFKLIATPTRGVENTNFVNPEDCGITVCVPGALNGKVVLNELLYDPVGTDSVGPTFIELRGEAGTDLTDAQLQFFSGSGTPGRTLTLGGVIPASGYYVVGQNLSITPDITNNFADLTNTGGFVLLVDCAEGVVDAVGYGAVTATGLGEDLPAQGTATNSGQSLVRCAGDTLGEIDSGHNSEDFDISTTPTPGELNSGFSGRVCEAGPCTTPLTDLVVINEFMPDEPGGESGSHYSFVELRGVPGTSLANSRLELVNGNLVGGAIQIYQSHSLTGSISDGSGGDVAGYFVIGESDVPNRDQTVSMDIQNGPDNIRLVDSCGNIVDAVGYGNFTDTHYWAGEPDTPRAPVNLTIAEGETYGRCGTADLDDADSDINADDFVVIPFGEGPIYAPNAGLQNPGCE